MFSSADIRGSLDNYYGNHLLASCLTILIFFLIVSVLAFLSHTTYYDNVELGKRPSSCWNRFVGSRFVRFLASPIDLLMHFLLGLNKDESAKGGSGQWADWHGGVSHIRSDVRRMIGASERNTSTLVQHEVNELESRMLNSSERVRTDVLTEIRSSEERLENMIAQLHTLLKETNSSTNSPLRQTHSGSFQNAETSIRPNRSTEF